MSKYDAFEEILCEMHDYINLSIRLSDAFESFHESNLLYVNSACKNDVNYYRMTDQERDIIELLKQHIQLSIDTFEAIRWYITPLVPPHTPDDLI